METQMPYPVHDALSRAPCGEPPEEAIVTDVQIAAIHSANTDADLCDLLELEPATVIDVSFVEEQRKDPDILEIVSYLYKGELPDCDKKAKRLAAQAPLFTLMNGILYFLDSKRGGRKRCVVPHHLRQGIIEENHSGLMAWTLRRRVIVQGLVMPLVVAEYVQ